MTEPRPGASGRSGEVARRAASLRGCRSPGDPLRIIDWCEEEISPERVKGDRALRLLSRWLVSAARKGAPVADSGPSAEGQIVLDVGPDAEVVSKPEAPEMPVQQAFPGGDKR